MTISILKRAKGPMNQLDPVTSSDLAAVALDLVAETAAGIRQSDEQSAHALQRERDIANEIREELGRAELRAERAEAMVRLAEPNRANVGRRRAGGRTAGPAVTTCRQDSGIGGVGTARG